MTELTNDREEAVVLVSGGMASATAAFEAEARGYEPSFLHVSHGQRTEDREYDCARRLAESLDGADFLHVETSNLGRLGASGLTDGGVEVEPGDADGEAVPASYVPFRNATLLAMAVSYAETAHREAVFVGAHSEDGPGSPDSRPAFFDAFQRVVDVGTAHETSIDVVAPFAEWSKTEIVERGLELGVSYELTWSCYRDDAPACGGCAACAERIGAFERAGADDPIEYTKARTHAQTG